jgi:hypothetical protein
MSVRYFIPRTFPLALVQWDGSNFDEVRQHVYYEINITVNDDNSLTLQRGNLLAVRCPLAGWVGTNGVVENNMIGKQEVASAEVDVLTQPRA